MFDPYHKWLAIPKDQRPPTYYQLLGISPTETDLEVIDEAALRQMAHIRAYQIGPHAALSQRILNEISQARTVLLNAEKRRAYDASLTPKTASAPAAAVPPAMPAPDMAAAVSAGPVVQKPVAAPWQGLDEPEWPANDGKRPAVPSVRKPAGSMPLLLILGIGGGALALVIATASIGLLWWMLGRGADVRPAPVVVAKNKDVAIAKDLAPRPAPKPAQQPDPRPILQPDPVVQPLPAPVDLGPPRPADYAALAKAIAGGQIGDCVIRPFVDRAPNRFFREVPKDGWVLIGFRCGVGKFGNIGTIYALQAIYRGPNGIQRGQEHGLFADGVDDQNRPIRSRVLDTQEIKAPEGFAVGGIRVRKGLNIDGMGLIFMKMHGNRLDPATALDSNWVGNRTGGQEMSVSGNGAIVLGISGAKDRDHVYSVGLVTLGAPNAVALGPVQPAAPPMPAPMPPGMELLQPADYRFKLNTLYQEVEVLFTDAERRVAGVLEVHARNQEDVDLGLYDLQRGGARFSSTRIKREQFSPCQRRLSPDGKYFSQSTLDNKINVWAVKTAQLVVPHWGLPRAKRQPGIKQSFDDDVLLNHCPLTGDRLLTVSQAGSVDIWKMPAMDLLQHTPGPNENLERGMAEVSLDRRRCAVFTRSNFWIVDVATGKVRKTVPLPPAQNGQRLDARLLAFNPSGSRLVAGVTGGGRRPTLYCYDTANGKLVSTTTNLAARDDRLDFYRLGWFGEEHIFLCRHDGDHRLYRAEDGAVIATMRHQFGHGHNILHAPDGRLWYCPNSNGNATLIGVSCPAALRGPAPAQPYALTLGPDGVLGSVPAAAAPAAPAPQDAAVFPEAPVEPDPAPPVQRAVASFNWNRKLTLVKGPLIPGFVAAFLDAKHCFTVNDTMVRLMSVPDGKPLASFAGAAGRIHGLAVSADGKRIATADQGKQVTIWDVQTREVLQRIAATDVLHSVAFSPGGKQIAAGGTHDVYLWDAATGKPLSRYTPGNGEWIKRIAFTPNGQHMAMGGQSFWVWNVRTRRLDSKDGPLGGVMNFAMSRHGDTYLLATSYKHLYRKAPGGTRALEEHPKAIHDVAFTADYHRLLVGGPGMVGLADANTGAPLGSLDLPEGDSWHVVPSPAVGRFAASNMGRNESYFVELK